MFKTKMSRYIYSMNLSLFDGAGAGSGGAGNVGGNVAGANGNGSSSSGSNGMTTAQQREAEINSRIPWDRLKNGKPAELNGSKQKNTTSNGSNGNLANSTIQNQNNNQNISEERWNEVKKGEFREFYNNDVATAVQNRLSKVHGELDHANAVNQELQNIVDAIKLRYPNADSNEALLNAINDDDGLIDQMAFDNGLTPEQYRESMAQQRQMNAEQQELQELRQWKLQQEQNREYENQLPAVLEKYPNFNIQEALQNPTFARALALQRMDGSEPSLLEAYEFAYRDQLMAQQINQTVQMANRHFTEQQIANSLLPNSNVTGGIAPSSQQLTKDKYEQAKALMKQGKSAGHLFR
jgi:hypothetical protein